MLRVELFARFVIVMASCGCLMCVACAAARAKSQLGPDAGGICEDDYYHCDEECGQCGVDPIVPDESAYFSDARVADAGRSASDASVAACARKPTLGIAEKIFSMPAVIVTATSHTSGISVTNA